MRLTDMARFAGVAVSSSWRRSALIGLATAIGVSAVVLLAALGNGANRFITQQFSALGTNLLIVIPGRNETVGGPPPLLGETPRDLTIEDAVALTSLPSIKRVAPVMVGNAPVSVASGLEREVTIIGSTADMAPIRKLSVGQGRFLPAGDPTKATAACVLGYDLRKQLFADAHALGEWIRVGPYRFRVVGVLADSGVSVGVDFNDVVIIPVAAAQAVFDSESLFRIIAEASSERDLDAGDKAIHRLIAARHEGEDDVTVIKQDSVVETLDNILGAVTFGVAGVSAISLAVAGILIMNVMLVAVTQRQDEIGLLKALGARSRDVRAIFLGEALILTLAGAVAGVIVGIAGAFTVGTLYPEFPVFVPRWAIASSLLMALAAGLIFGVLPARRAAKLDPVVALSKR